MNLQRSTGLYLISNPNLYRDGVSYADIYPDGFYAKYAPELGVEKLEMTQEQVVSCFREIGSLVDGRPVVYLGHLNHPDKPSATRQRNNAAVREAARAIGARFFDTEDLTSKHGFLRDANGIEDVHHLSHEGEMAVGTALQALCRDLR